MYLCVIIITHADGSCWGWVFTAICLFFHMILQKPMQVQLRKPRITKHEYAGSTMSPENHLLWGQGHESQKQCRCGFL